MNRRSLRLRLAAGGVVAIVAALAIAGAGVTILFERHIARTIADDLDIHLRQLIAGLDVDPQGRLVESRPPVDPRFFDPLSGLYWQVASKDGQLLRSRSLWDTTLFLPDDEVLAGETHRHEAMGPSNSRLLVVERGIAMTIRGQSIPVHIAVGVDLARVAAARRAFAKELAGALGLLGLVLAAGTVIQVALGLRPLNALRRDIADIRSGRRQRVRCAAPTEVQPLVDEVNALLASQEREIERSRSRASDLAHGLKTPLAALTSDAGRLREHGEQKIARDIEAVSEAMSRQIDREIARARIRARVVRAADTSTELAPLVHSLIATVARTPAGIRLTFETSIPNGATVPFDRADLAEVMGNLLENASRHANSRIRLRADFGPEGTSMTVEDDGQGIAPAERSKVLERGTRLDEIGEGAGLGLAIVLDVLEAYGWSLVLDTSELGGLKAIIMPSAGGDCPELCTTH
jgi:signal transduction histidine kinase